MSTEDHRTPKQTSIHGVTLIDEYHWLRGRDEPAVLQWLRDENERVETTLAPLKPLREELQVEMRARIVEDDRTVPARFGRFEYYTRTETGAEYPIHCRRPIDATGEEQILLDVNELAKGHDYFRLGAMRISPDQHRVAYSCDTSGGEEFVVHIRDLADGTTSDAVIRGAGTGLDWQQDGQALYFTTLDETKRPCRLWRQRLEQGVEPEMVFEEPDERFFLSVRKTRERGHLVIACHSKISSEVRLLDLRATEQPTDALRLVRARQQGVEYEVAVHRDTLFVLTNLEALDFRVMTAPLGSPGAWQDWLAHRPGVLLTGIDAFHGRLVVSLRRDGLTNLEVHDLNAKTSTPVAFDEAAYTVEVDQNLEFDTSILRYRYTSLTTPSSVFDYDMGTGTPTLRKRQEVAGGYDPEAYVTHRAHATAPDGTLVPISLVHRRDLGDGPAPCLLYGYGSYGLCIEPEFRSTRLSLLDRGFVFAIAHIRGGSEMGRSWYENGKMGHKPNTFGDFIACARHLIDTGRTTAGQLAIQGGSAGGLLMGAVLNAEPGLFGAAIAQVPFVDVVHTMLDDSLPLTVTEYEEWGNPNEADAFRVMHSYSPYDNVRATDYPAMLVTAGLHDPRVQYWEPAKWVARLRERKTDDNWLLLRTEMSAGHSGKSGRFEMLEEIALSYAFLLATVGRATERR